MQARALLLGRLQRRLGSPGTFLHQPLLKGLDLVKHVTRCGTQTLDPGYTPLIKDLFSYDFFSDFNIPHLNDTVSFDENNTQTYASDEMQIDFADQEVLGLETPLFNEEFEDTYHCSDYDPASLVDLTTNSSRIIALPFKKTGSDTPVYIPVNFMQNIFGKVGLWRSWSLYTMRQW